MTFTDFMESPLGPIQITATDSAISAVSFDVTATGTTGNAVIQECIRQLGEYFQGSRTIFDLPLAPQGTEFQKSVWEKLKDIKFGESCSYLDIANAIGNPKSIRAVGGANGKNPISIIVPCHRVIGSDKSLTGYAGGLSRKKWLLEHEGILFQQPTPSEQLSLL